MSNQNCLNWILTIIVLSWLCSATITAQNTKEFSKIFTDGNRVYLKKQIIIEIRSRTRKSNPKIPESELFQVKEWIIHTYDLILVQANRTENITLWKYRREYNSESKEKIPQFGIGN